MKRFDLVIYGPVERVANDDALLTAHKNYLTAQRRNKLINKIILVSSQSVPNLLDNYFDNTPINLGTGEEVTIKELAYLVSEVVNYKGNIVFDDSKPDGIPRKILDSSKILKLGWKPSISLLEGLERTYRIYLDNSDK